jgi:hypothetical protein
MRRLIWFRTTLPDLNCDTSFEIPHIISTQYGSADSEKKTVLVGNDYFLRWAQVFVSTNDVFGKYIASSCNEL